jgi:hypothetical protein
MGKNIGIVLEDILNQWDNISTPIKIIKKINNNFKINDRVYVRSEWASSKQSYGVITKFENRGREVFAVIRWVGWKAPELEKDLGVKFPLHELTKKC